MGLESGTYVSDLVSSNPLAGDNSSQGDDHIRLLKALLLATFPNASRAFRFPDTDAVVAGDVTTDVDDMHKVIPINATAAARTANLGAVTIDAWWAIVVKTDSSSNTVTIDPAGATTINGAASVTLTNQYEAMICWWDGEASEWRGFRMFPTKPYYSGGQDIPLSDIAPSPDAKRILAATTATDYSPHTIAAVLEFISASLARGDLLMRGASAFDRFAPGTSGHFLQSAGSAADLVWALPLVPARAYGEYTSNADITTEIPADDTIPQVGEGTEIISISITPTKASSRIRFEFTAFGSVNGTSHITAALFLNGAANALRSTVVRPSVSQMPHGLHLVYEYAPGSVTAITASIRVGREGASGVVALNGIDGARLYGGTAAATLTATELFTA